MDNPMYMGNQRDTSTIQLSEEVNDDHGEYYSYADHNRLAVNVYDSVPRQ